MLCLCTFCELAALDAKSIALNMASTLLFVLPIACYFFMDYTKHLCGTVVGAFAVALALPPYGWKRPHPYSDMPDNVPPYARKKQ
jgi:hypothetical protein